MGLPSDGSHAEKRKELVADKILGLLFRYIDNVVAAQPTRVLSPASPSSPSSSSSSAYYGRVSLLGVYCITYCQLIQRTDILFGDIFDRFKSEIRLVAPSTPSAAPSPSAGTLVDGSGIFLELLEPFILSNRLTVLTPEITQQFVQHYSEKALAAATVTGSSKRATEEGIKKKNNILHRVQQCLLHLDIATIDFHQVRNNNRAHFYCCVYDFLCLLLVLTLLLLI